MCRPLVHMPAGLLDGLVHMQDLGFLWETVGTPKIWRDLGELRAREGGAPGTAPGETAPTKPPEVVKKDLTPSTQALRPGRCARWSVSRRWEPPFPAECPT